ncbi:10440_t:CDS:2 [Gigaspora margarita]|uniref:10440_t:CDS:1 n=1 Tax=Gigaspora margarita TaxID=4874 RepID=A0ABN7VI90_GIGMA|nr:10440_t:CDS:2 [Gigaspora margarita]
MSNIYEAIKKLDSKEERKELCAFFTANPEKLAIAERILSTCVDFEENPLVNEENIITMTKNWNTYYLLGKDEQGSNISTLGNIIFKNKKTCCRITGNPGIGKTFFGFYLLYLLLQQRKTVNYLANEEVWYIVDGREPMNYVAKTILICSPQKCYYRNFDKLGPTIRYMPVWSWKEIDTCRIKIFRYFTQKYVQKLYNEWGGTSRFTLFNALNHYYQYLFKKAINSVNNELLNFVEPSMTSKSPAVTRPDKRKGVIGKGRPFYSMSTLEFASDYVSEGVIDKFIKIYKVQLENFVKASSSISDYGFTLYSRQMSLVSDGFSEIAPDMYCIPTQKNSISFDAFVFPDTFFQMTVSESHSIIKSGLEKYINKDDNSDIKFYFVLPKKRYDSYQKQVLYTTKRTVLKSMPPWINRFKQYALEIDLEL